MMKYFICLLCLGLVGLTSKLANAETSPGAFAAGQSQLSIGGGTSSIGEGSYLILQGRYGYFWADGLVAELGLQGWVPLDDDLSSIYVFTPGVTAYLYQLGVVVPYAGAFYQYALSEQPLDETSAIGARAGIVLRQGGGFLGLGARVTQGIECGKDCRTVSPEFSLMLSF